MNVPNAILIRTREKGIEGSHNSKVLKLIRDILKQQKDYFSEIIEVEEIIDSKGNIVTDLEESKINPVLREVYKLKPDIVFILFSNSDKNPAHERALRNILQVAGYKSIYISSEQEPFISILSIMFAKTNL